MSFLSSIRRNQLIVPFGPGALQVLKGGKSVVTGGLDNWHQDRSGAGCSMDELDKRGLIVLEPRLAAILNVSHFRLPPSKTNRRGDDDTELVTPVYRFPTWFVCGRCGKMKKSNLNNPGRHICPNDKCFNSPMQQMGFACVCKNGHLQDFPWLEWAHYSDQIDEECRSQMRYDAKGGGSLSDIRIRCERCGTKWRDLSGVTFGSMDADGKEWTFLTNNLFNKKSNEEHGRKFFCEGGQPWLGIPDSHDCIEPLKMVLSNGTNLHFSIIRSSIYVPALNRPSADDLMKVLDERNVRTLIRTWRKSDDELEDIARKLKRKLKNLDHYTDEELIDALAQHDEAPFDERRSAGASSFEELKYEEYWALLYESGREGELITRKCEKPKNLNSETSMLIDEIIAVEKLRETSAFAGFTRLFYDVPEEMGDPQHLLWKDYPSDIHKRWLPASVTFGEGIFLSINNQILRDWSLKENVSRHINILQNNYNDCVSQYGWSELTVLPQFVFLHTLSHLLINELVFECGYGVASLRERIYCSNEASTEMYGILIYSAAGDSEGTMGGLVRQSEPHLFGDLLSNALEKAQWCSSDPICAESSEQGGQGPFSLNLAACHSCSLLPETSCEHFNRFLDRSVVNKDSPYSLISL